MGSFSVPCAISGITITEGQAMGMIPLVKSTYAQFTGVKPGLQPFCLPLWGKYDDYGRIALDEFDDNHKLVESVVGDVQAFCDNLTDGEEEHYVMGDVDLSKLTYCFVHRDIFEKSAKLRSYVIGGAADMHVGDHDILTYLGFTKLEEAGSHERYDRVYELNGTKLYSDGRWLHGPDMREGIYDIHKLDKYGCDTSFFKNKAWVHCWSILQEKKAKECLFHFVGIKEMDFMWDDDEWNEIMAEIKVNKDNALEKVRAIQRSARPAIRQAYWDTQSKYVKDLAADFYTVLCNLYPASRQIEPYSCCVTPQFGEHEAHLDYVKAIVSVLRQKIKEYDIE